MIDARHRRRLPLGIAELRGLIRLGGQATEGVTEVVEHLHQSVLDTIALRTRRAGPRTTGITCAVYRSIRGLTRGVVMTLDHALGRVQQRDPETADPHTLPLNVLSALNGVVGDRLAGDGNPLAIAMQLRCDDRPIDHEGGVPAHTSSRLLLTVHGLCMNERQWRGVRDGRTFDHPGAIAAALGCTRVDLRYNSGLHIAENGRQLAQQLEALLAIWPCPVERLSVIAHSMGGLVIRSACAQAIQMQMVWPGRVREIAFLGTPHHGAPLERGGQWLHRLLGIGRFGAPFARLARVRSAGITDLRHGNVLDLPATDRFESREAGRRPLPLPAHIAHFAIAASLGRSSAGGAGWLGDGLVPVASALGEHEDPALALGFAPDRRWISLRTGHLELLSKPQVCRRLLEWWRAAL